MTLSTGYENERLPDPDLNRFALPGGALLGLTPGIRAGGPLGERVWMDVSGQLGYERFPSAAARAVLGAVVQTDLSVRLAGSWAWRSTAVVSRYSDSAFPTADRTGGGLETALGISRSAWSLEALGGVDARRYDNLVVRDDAGSLVPYSESDVNLGLGGLVRLGTGGFMSARVLWQETEARDPLYDAGSWLAQGSARVRVGREVFLTLSALGQLRRFTSRSVAVDEDSYWQVGAGLDRAVTRTVRVTARYAFARVVDPLGGREDLYRATLSATWGIPPLFRAGVEAGLRLPGGPAAPHIHENDLRLFRCHAPGAHSVSLVGDFNGWDPGVHPLEPQADGWWRIEVRLPAGSHTYAYIVDGRAVAPADAEALVDDGFGGKNGLVWVQAEGL